MERNYAEDQANEVEALESIYCDDIEGKKVHIYSQLIRPFFYSPSFMCLFGHLFVCSIQLLAQVRINSTLRYEQRNTMQNQKVMD